MGERLCLPGGALTSQNAHPYRSAVHTRAGKGVRQYAVKRLSLSILVWRGFLSLVQRRYAMKRPVLVLVVMAALLGPRGLATPARAADPQTAAQGAIGWLVARQMDDGSFPGFDAGASADAIFAITAIGSDPNGVLKNGNSPVSYLGSQAARY